MSHRSGEQGELCALHYCCDGWNQLKGGGASYSHTHTHINTPPSQPRQPVYSHHYLLNNVKKNRYSNCSFSEGKKGERGGEELLFPSQRLTVELSSLPAKETCSMGSPTRSHGSRTTREVVLLHKCGTEVLKNSAVPPSSLPRRRLTRQSWERIPWWWVCTRFFREVVQSLSIHGHMKYLRQH